MSIILLGMNVTTKTERFRRCPEWTRRKRALIQILPEIHLPKWSLPKLPYPESLLSFRLLQLLRVNHLRQLLLLLLLHPAWLTSIRKQLLLVPPWRTWVIIHHSKKHDTCDCSLTFDSSPFFQCTQCTWVSITDPYNYFNFCPISLLPIMYMVFSGNTLYIYTQMRQVRQKKNFLAWWLVLVLS